MLYPCKKTQQFTKTAKKYDILFKGEFNEKTLICALTALAIAQKHLPKGYRCASFATSAKKHRTIS